MADIQKRVSENTEGEFFVDSTCINCDTCRQLAPQIFKDSGIILLFMLSLLLKWKSEVL